MEIRDRVKELRRVPAKDLIRNPHNWRKHPFTQQSALMGALTEIGYADALIAYETEDGLQLIDGHLRAETTPDSIVPVLVVDLNETEANKLLATLDPLAAMAQTDIEAFLNLVVDVETESNALKGVLEAIANNEINPMPDFTNMVTPPTQEEIDAHGESLENRFTEGSENAQADMVDLTCPECSHEFSLSMSALQRLAAVAFEDAYRGKS
jgi:hypothetical protein